MSDETHREEAAVAADTGGFYETWDRVRDQEWFVVVLTAIGLILFPWLFVEGRAPFVSTALHGYQGLAELILVWAIFVVGFDLLHGYTGLLSFGHAAFWGTGAYVAGIVSSALVSNVVGFETGFPVVMIVTGTVASVLLAWVLGFLSLRRGGIYFAILTLAFGQMLYFMALQPLAPITNGDNGFTNVNIQPLLGTIPLEESVPVIGMLVGRWLYVLFAVVTVLAVAAAYRILNSPYGMVFRAIRENEQRAEFVGLDVGRYKLMSFILSGGFAGVAGSLFAIKEAYVPVESLFWTTSGEVVIMSVIGGVGSLFGALFGAGIYLYVEFIVSGMTDEIILFYQIDQFRADTLSQFLPEAVYNAIPPLAVTIPVDLGIYWHLILGLVFVAVVVFFQEGAWGAIRSLRRRVRGDR